VKTEGIPAKVAKVAQNHVPARRGQQGMLEDKRVGL